MLTAEDRLDIHFNWNKFHRNKPKEKRDYLVFVAHVDQYGAVRGFISINHWDGKQWDYFNESDDCHMPHITHWIEWLPEKPLLE